MKKIRCPYCIEGAGFKVLSTREDYLECDSCGHKVALYHPTFRCSCANCDETERRVIEIPARW